MESRVRILCDDEILQIEAEALRVLHEIGVLVDNDDLCEILRKAGLLVPGNLVRMPPEIVRWALSAASRSIVLHGRNGQALPLRHGFCHLATYGEAVNVADYRASGLRPSTLQDTVNFVRLGQAMTEITIVNPVCFARDLPAPVQLLRTAEAVVRHSDKHHNVAPLNLEEAQMWYELVSIASPEADPSATSTVSFVVSTTSPLRLDYDTATVLRFAAEKKIPFIAASCPMAGGTSPLALVGTIVQHLAEDLFVLTVAQLISEGAPVILGGAAGILDMRTGALSYGAPERHLLLGAIIELADHFGLPHHSPAGSVDAWYPDVHAGAEKMQCWMTRKAKDIMFGISFGSLYNGSAVSLEQMVIDADLWHTAERFFLGIDLAELGDSVAAIRRTGPGGNFLADEQTHRLLRSRETYYSPIANRDGDRGASMLERAHGRVEKILAAHRYEPAPAVAADISRYVSDKERYLLKGSR